MFDISITTTASLRPNILFKTYTSFLKNLIGIDHNTKLFINIDPIRGHGKYDIDPVKESIIEAVDKVTKVAENFFKNIEIKTPIEPCFSCAVKWLWESASTEFILHIEDDWELLMPIKLVDLIKFFDKKSVQQVRLQPFIKFKERWRKYGLSPCIMRKEFYKKMISLMLARKNPEKRIRSGAHLFYPVKNGVVFFPKHRVVKDLVRYWNP